MLRGVSSFKTHILSYSYSYSPPGRFLFPCRRRLCMASSPWPCSRCTFLNPPSRLFSCQLCLLPTSPSAAPSSSSPPKWSCRACTFSNPPQLLSCEICGTESSPNSISIAIDSSSGLKLGACGYKRDLGDVISGEESNRREKSARMESTAGIVENSDIGPRSKPNIYKIMSYNVWFREDLELEKRMHAIGCLIEEHSPHVICLQEVTPDIYKIFRGSDWWRDYECSVPWRMASERGYFCMQLCKLPVKSFTRKPFNNSIMGRELCIADIATGPASNILVATTHLESPCPGPPKWDQMYTKERVSQAEESIQILDTSKNVIFCGDMNWDDKLDDEFPAPATWVDAWAQLRPDEEGWTYDTKSNPMISENRKLQRRLDRFLCKLPGFEIVGIEMIGREALPGLSYLKEKKVRREMKTLELPVLPSDHFGLLLTIQGK